MARCLCFLCFCRRCSSTKGASLLHTSTRVRLMAAASGWGGGVMGVQQGRTPPLLSFRVGELLGGITGRAGPMRRKDSVSAKDSVLGRKLSLLADKDSL